MKTFDYDFTGGQNPVRYMVLHKNELEALAAVQDKNPRSKWLFLNTETETLWTAGANRALRATATGTRADAWWRCPLDELTTMTPGPKMPNKKPLKPLVRDFILLRQQSADVVEVILVKYHAAKGTLDETTDFTEYAEKQDELPGKGVEKVIRKTVSIPLPGEAEYTLDAIEAMFTPNTGASVPKVLLQADHLAMMAKTAKAMGKGGKLTMSPGRGNVPCLFHGAADGVKWTYSLLEDVK